MRPIAILALLVLAAPALAASGSYLVPPIGNLSSDNLDIAPSLENSYDANYSQAGSIQIRFGQYSQPLSLNASIAIAGMSAMADNMTYPVEGLSVIVERGYQQGHLMSLPNSGYPNFACNLYWFQHISDETAWRCDFDSDTCSEFENSSSVRYDLDATFAFRNVSETLRMDSNVVPVPDDVLAAMRDSSGNDSLNVTVEGNVTFIYNIDDRIPQGQDCFSNYTNVSSAMGFSVSRNFTVAGTRKLFFMRSPPLREQWVMSNAFDMIVLSQSPLYWARISMDGAPVRSFQLRNFSIVENRFGLEELVSDSAHPTGSSESQALSRPVQLEYSNSSYLYAYEFNYSYAGQAAGAHSLLLAVNDSFGGSANYSDTLASRYLSYNGTQSEKGTPAAAQPTRGSGSFSTDTLAHVEIGLGLVAMVLVLAFINFWLT